MSTSIPPTDQSIKAPALVDELRHRIERGEWKPGERLPSYSESRALFGAHSVALEKAHAQLEREGLIVRERGRGIFVAARAPHPAKVRSGLIGVAGKGFSFKEYSPYWGNLLSGIREVCDEAESQIILLDYQSNKGWEKADGVLICDWSSQITLQWLPPAMPCVSLLMPVSGMASVYTDDYGGAYAATEYLIRLGHKKIAYMHTREHGVMPRRVAGWRAALEDAGITPQAFWERTMSSMKLDFGERFVERGRTTMQEWLHSDWHQRGFTAVLAHNDETATGIIGALQEANIRVPQDVSVMGFDGAAPSEYGAPLLTTMQVPLAEIGRTATSLLLRRLNGEEAGDQHRVFTIAVREGRSTGPATKPAQAEL